MEILDFEFFIDREKNKPCLIAGNAPTVANFPFDKFKGIYILCNEGPRLLRKLVSPNYWVSANYDFPVPQKHLKIINSIKDYIFIFADTAIYWQKYIYDYNFLKENLKIPWFGFDDRHFGHKKCEPLQNCCGLVDLYPNRVTLQEFMEHHFGLENARQETGTIIVYSLMFAILMGCSPIYLQGVELPLRTKDYGQHYNATFRLMAQDFCLILKAHLDEWLHGEAHSHIFYSLKPTLSHFENMANLCHKLGIEIYNLSPTSTLNKVKSLPYLDYRKV